jgi:tRNA A37 threonylcarbamoyladenosine dehydratase
MTSWLSRTEMLIGPEGIHGLKSSHVLVVGLGGVGSWQQK